MDLLKEAVESLLIVAFKNNETKSCQGTRYSLKRILSQGWILSVIPRPQIKNFNKMSKHLRIFFFSCIICLPDFDPN